VGAAPDPALVRKAVSILRGARRVLVVTGAGISADAGLPTYRGVGGLYDGVRTEDGLPIEEVL
jgi:NAD-dependent deacetylase